MNTITNLNTFPIGNSLDGVNIITDEISTLSLLVDGTNSMLADLNMNNHTIKNLEAGVDSLDAVNKNQLDTKADTTYVNTQDNLRVLKSGDTMTGILNMSSNKITNVANGMNNLDAVNRSQLNTKADTTYVNTQDNLRLKRDGTDVMTGSLNMNSNKIINVVNGSNPNDAINFSQLNGLSNALTQDINDLEFYVDSSLNSLRTYVDTQDNLKVNKAGDTMTDYLRTPEIRLIGQTTTFNNNSIYPVDESNRTNTYAVFEPAGSSNDWAYLRQIGGSNNIHLSLDFHDDTNDGKFSLRSINSVNNPDSNPNTFFYSSPTGTTINSELNMSSKKIKSVANGENSNDAVNKSQLDLKADTTYVDTQDNLKVNRAGDTITGDLTINGSCYSNKQFVVYNSTSPSTRDRLLIYDNVVNNLGYLYYNEDGTLGSNETNGTVRWSIDNNGSASLSNSTLTKNASNSLSTLTSSSLTLDLTSGTIYDIYNLTYSGLSPTITLFVPSTTGGTNLLGKSLNITFPSNKSVALSCSIGETITLNGTNYTTTTPDITSPFSLIIDSANQGVYYTGEYKSLTNTDQLTIRSYLDTNANSEFTGIRFLNTNTECGFIRVDANRDHIDANMAFYVRQNNSIINPLTINSNIITDVPIVRNAWSSGELIKTQIYNQNTNGTGVITVSSQSNIVWKQVNFLMKNPVYNGSQIVIKIDAPYFISGYSQDVMEIKVFDKTFGGIATEIFRKSQYYGTNTGSGTRSSPIFPAVISYVPSTTTSTNRSISIEFYNLSNDTLYICQGATQFGSTFGLVNMDYYTIEINEIKL